MTHWTDRNVFITGATGLVGSYLTKRLADMGADVVVLVRDHVPQNQLIRNGYFDKVKRVTGEVTDKRLIERILGEYEIDTVYHLAAQTCVPIANRNPWHTFNTNIMGSVAILEGARKASTVTRIVVSSSDKAYGDKGQAYTEDMPLNGEHPYDASKSSQDLIAAAYGHSFDMSVAVARCGNIYGGGDLNWSRLIPGTIRRLLRGQSPLVNADGLMMRDYFYIDDCVDAYVLLGESDKGGAWNFGGNQPATVLDVVAQIQKILGTNIPNEFRGSRNEIDSQWLDITKARTQLGFEPKCSLTYGLQKTCEWYKEFLQ